MTTVTQWLLLIFLADGNIAAAPAPVPTRAQCDRAAAPIIARMHTDWRVTLSQPGAPVEERMIVGVACAATVRVIAPFRTLPPRTATPARQL